MWEREKISLTKDFDNISANVLEVVDALNNLWYNQELEEKFSDAFTDVCEALDKLRLVRKDFEDLRDNADKGSQKDAEILHWHRLLVMSNLWEGFK